MSILGDMNGPKTVYLTSPEVGTEILRVEPGPRVFIEGEETADVERIGAAFVRWAALIMAREAQDHAI